MNNQTQITAVAPRYAQKCREWQLLWLQLQQYVREWEISPSRPPTKEPPPPAPTAGHGG
ncbi:hypothetical protein Q5H92_23170 [Hymenobacter sp. M29]|uniref:Uncharacterized protein n=1 Tax=Hymenobacter mellowenesis TaxID=3063995 RepID=A0ABT9AHD6_9BACT|nr:hypothetical protein [Hymenobacter sp. M29]MDO7849284.1 hypothetical protein [Hymenobacter sp. M29]